VPAMDLQEQDLSVKKMKEIFKKYDQDGDGTISRKSLEEILRRLCPGISQSDLDLVFRKIDKNYNNAVEYDEFVNLLFFNPLEEDKNEYHHLSWEISYNLFLFWDIVAGHQRRPGPISKAKLIEACQLDSRALKALRLRISKLQGDEYRAVVHAEERTISRLTSVEVKQRLMEAPSEVTQEAFVRALWPKIKRFDLKYVVGMFRRFFAQEGLSRVLRAITQQKTATAKVDMPASDLKFLFDVLDEDDDGTLSIKEMVQHGALEVHEALYLSERLDKGQDGEISLAELMSLVTGHVGSEFVDSMKGLFAAKR